MSIAANINDKLKVSDFNLLNSFEEFSKQNNIKTPEKAEILFAKLSDTLQKGVEEFVASKSNFIKENLNGRSQSKSAVIENVEEILEEHVNLESSKVNHKDFAQVITNATYQPVVDKAKLMGYEKSKAAVNKEQAFLQ